MTDKKMDKNFENRLLVSKLCALNRAMGFVEGHDDYGYISYLKNLSGDLEREVEKRFKR